MVKNITLLIPGQLCSLFLLTICSLCLLTICSLCLLAIRLSLLSTNRIYVLMHGLLGVIAPHIITHGINSRMNKVSIILCVQPVIYNAHLLICEYRYVILRSSLSLTQRLNI